MKEEKQTSFLRHIYKLILDSLFPIYCLGCKKNEEWLCEKCLTKIVFLIDQVCPVCEKNKTPNGRTCFSCKKRSSLDGLLVCSSYKEKLINLCIQNFKYKFVSDLYEPLGNIMTSRISESSLPLPDLIIPVPLHKKRLRWRGFNQSELLSGYISKNLTPGFEIPVFKNILQRNKNTKSQMKIKDYKQRGLNISGAFSAKKSSALNGKSIFLIDDVATTGSTISECAKVLKKSGAKEVFGIVIARQEIRRLLT